MCARSLLKKLAGYRLFIGLMFGGMGWLSHAGVRGGVRTGGVASPVRLGRPAAGLPGAGWRAEPVAGAGQVASTQAPPCQVRPRPIKVRRFSAAVRRLSQAWFLVTPR